MIALALRLRPRASASCVGSTSASSSCASAGSSWRPLARRAPVAQASWRRPPSRSRRTLRSCRECCARSRAHALAVARPDRGPQLLQPDLGLVEEQLSRPSSAPPSARMSDDRVIHESTLSAAVSERVGSRSRGGEAALDVLAAQRLGDVVVHPAREALLAVPGHRVRRHRDDRRVTARACLCSERRIARVAS